MLKKILFITLFLSVNLLSCTLFQTSDTTDVLLPDESETPGWRVDGFIEKTTAENLHEYVKESEKSLILAYGFKELSSAKYKNISSRNNEIIVEIFTMNSPLNAFGIFSMERIDDSDDFKDENLCENSYSISDIDSKAFFLRKKNYYIKVRGSTDAVGDFAGIICNKIKGSNPLPGHQSLFENKDNRNSLKYRIDGHSRLPVLKKIFTRKIEIFGQNKTIFFTKRDSRYITMGEFSSLLKDKEKRFILCSAEDSQTAFLKRSDKDFIFISVFKEWIFGIMDAESMAQGEKTINYLYNDLQKFLKENR